MLFLGEEIKGTGEGEEMAEKENYLLEIDVQRSI